VVRRVITVAVAVCCALSLSVGANAALDRSFGTRGKLVIEPEGRMRGFFATDTSIVAAGFATIDNFGMAAFRFSASGVPDPSFGGDTDGVAITDVVGQAVGIANRQGGGYWLGGYASNNVDDDFALVALTTTGQVDTTFGGGDGIVTIDLGQEERAFAMDVDSSGNILLAGLTMQPTQPISDFAVARFTAAGSPDATFGTAGVATVDVGVNDIAFDVAATASGKTIVVGGVHEDLAAQMAILRLELDGDPDTTFSGDGLLTPAFATRSEAKAVAVLPSGKLLVGGTAWKTSAATMDFVVTRITPQGTVDAAFGSASGRTITDFGGRDEVADLAVISDASILLAGPVDGILGSALDFGLARYSRAGILDPRFGKQQTHFFTDKFGNRSEDIPTTIAVLGDGRFIVGGSSTAHLFPQCCPHQPALARYKDPGPACTRSGNAANNTLLGTRAADVLCALDGNDVVRGRGGADVIFGGSGDDRLFGDGGQDRLFGDAGSDDLDGGPGTDSCFGGSGRNTKVSC
jgi:uncharacterized delta-60 repeat protein